MKHSALYLCISNTPSHPPTMSASHISIALNNQSCSRTDALFFTNTGGIHIFMTSLKRNRWLRWKQKHWCKRECKFLFIIPTCVAWSVFEDSQHFFLSAQREWERHFKAMHSAHIKGLSVKADITHISTQRKCQPYHICFSRTQKNKQQKKY